MRPSSSHLKVSSCVPTPAHPLIAGLSGCRAAAPPEAEAPQVCQASAWGPDAPPKQACGDLTTTKQRAILHREKLGGAPCGTLTKVVTTSTQACGMVHLLSSLSCAPVIRSLFPFGGCVFVFVAGLGIKVGEFTAGNFGFLPSSGLDVTLLSGYGLSSNFVATIGKKFGSIIPLPSVMKLDHTGDADQASSVSFSSRTVVEDPEDTTPFRAIGLMRHPRCVSSAFCLPRIVIIMRRCILHEQKRRPPHGSCAICLIRKPFPIGYLAGMGLH